MIDPTVTGQAPAGPGVDSDPARLGIDQLVWRLVSLYVRVAGRICWPSGVGEKSCILFPSLALHLRQPECRPAGAQAARTNTVPGPWPSYS